MGSASGLAGQPPSWPRIILAPFQDRNRCKTFLRRSLTSSPQRCKGAHFRGARSRQVRTPSCDDREQTWRHDACVARPWSRLRISLPDPREVRATYCACASGLRDRPCMEHDSSRRFIWVWRDGKICVVRLQRRAPMFLARQRGDPHPRRLLVIGGNISRELTTQLELTDFASGGMR